MLKKFGLILLLYFTLKSPYVSAEKVDNADYNYHDPNKWVTSYPECGGKNQSPVALLTKNVKKVNYSSPLRLKGLLFKPDSASLEFDGRHVFVHFNWKDGPNVTTITGGPLGDNEYELKMGIFTWSHDSEGGSEHTVDGERAPVGLLLVLVNMKYSDFAEAITKHDGLAVIEKRIEEANDSGEEEINKALLEILPSIPKIPEPNDQVEIDPFLILDFVTPEDRRTGKFPLLMYKGSMSVPPCHETVTWFVSNQPIFATSEMIHTFHKLKLLENDTKNYRPVQPLNDREVVLLEGQS